MERSIEKFTQKLKNGLYLIDMPTGVGKTYQAIEYIYDHFEENRKFFYITSLNKNVDSAYDSLKEKFQKANRMHDFTNGCIRLYANAEKVIDELGKITLSDDNIMKLNSFRELKHHVDVLNNIKTETNEILEGLTNDIKEKYEPAFRHEVEIYLSQQKSNKRERYQYVKDNHKWLIDIYPAIESSYKKVYFMSLDKFYLGNSTIIESTYKFTDRKDMYDQAIVFIDEIDAAKDTILNREIEESLKNNINIFKLFIDIRNTLETKKFPQEMLRSSRHNQNDKNRQKEILIEMKRIFSNDFNEYNMQYAFKTLEKDIYRKYIFDDGTYSTIAQDNNQKEIFVIKNDNENYNYLSFKDDGSGIKLSKVLGTINGAIKYFLNGIFLLAINYLEYYNEHKNKNDDAMQYYDAVQSIVKAFNIENSMIPYVCNLVTGNITTKQRYNTTFSTSIYDSGFRYYHFEDNINNNLSTNIRMYNLWDTPESFMLQLAQKSYVVGLSATSTLETVTGNFDIEYLKQHLGESYYVPSDEEKEAIDKYVENAINSNNSKIHVHIVKNVDIEELFSDEDNIAWLDNLLSITLDAENDFQKKRFLKVLKVIKGFISEEQSKSIILLSNRNLSEKKKNLYSADNIKAYIDRYKAEIQNNDDFEVINLVTKNFEEKKKEYQSHINNNKRVIIFSSYPTTGAGQNLQYEYIVNNSKEDIDSIYVDNPTNLLVQTSNFNQEKVSDLIKYIFQIESLNTSGEVSLNDKFVLIKEAFGRMSNPTYKLSHKNAYETNSVKNHGLRVLIQAIGRICRTKDKCKDVNIYLDDTINDKIRLNQANGRKLNREFEAILDATKEINKSKVNLPYFISQHRAQTDSKKISDIIHNFISRKEWSSDLRDEWKKLRQQVLKYPTATIKDLGKNGEYANCYLKSDDYPIAFYYYQQEDDYGNVKISLKQEDKYAIISEKDSLAHFMKNEMIRNYFIEKGYATTFEKNNYIMLPIIFNNIYKGALGEEVGSLLFKKEIGIELLDITDGKKFEKFDFEYNGYYFDFKNWQNTPYSKVDIQKFDEKANIVGAKKAFIINVLGINSNPITEKEKLIIIPSLIDCNTGKINKEAFIKIVNIIKR